MYFEQLGMDLSVLRSSVRAGHFTGFDVIKSQFWKSALEIWLNLKNDEIIDLENTDEIASQPLWNNALVQYKGKSLFFKRWVEGGYVHVGDMFIDDRLVTLDHLVTYMGPDSRLSFQYYALYNALPAAWRNPDSVGVIDSVQPVFPNVPLTSVTTKMIRQSLMKDKQKVSSGASFWKRKFPSLEINKKIYMRIFKATKETRLRVLQWKIIHNIYPTNILLNKIGIRNSSNCSCGEKDYIEHFFCTCVRIRPIWNSVKEKIFTEFGLNLEVTMEHKMFGVSEADVPQYTVKEINHLLIIAKMCISKFIYGDYGNLLTLFDHELKLRQVYQH